MIKAKDFEWDTFDGETQGIYGNFDWEVYISARPTAKDIRWGEKDTNVRQWSVTNDFGMVVASGEADGVRACKTAALAAING